MTNIEDEKLKLLLGLPMNTVEVGEIHSPNIKTVVEMGYSKYNSMISTLLLNRSMFSNLDEDIHMFDLLIMTLSRDENFREEFKQACSLIFQRSVDFFEDETEEYYLFLGDFENRHYITKENYEKIQNYLEIALQAEFKKNTEDEYKPANEEARKLIEAMLKRRKKGRANKEEASSNFHSLISLVVTDRLHSHKKILDMTIYQFMDFYKRLESIEKYRNTHLGIYTGNMETKKINFNEINWTKIID